MKILKEEQTVEKACCDCCYLAEENGKFYCNFGDSENYGKEVQARNYCEEFEQ